VQRRYNVKTTSTDDLWVVAAEVRPRIARTSNGTPGKDRAKIDLVLATQPPTAEMRVVLPSRTSLPRPPLDTPQYCQV
jgi:hypothetical protein